MQAVGLIRLSVLRAMYAFIALGLLLSIWPGIIAGAGKTADAYTVVNAFLAAITLLSLLGIRYPLALLPVLLFELLWKTIWLLAYALPVYLSPSGLDEYAAGVAFACIIGVVLTSLAIPWGYVVRHYVLAKGERWH